jgi:hypothetical protein
MYSTPVGTASVGPTPDADERKKVALAVSSTEWHTSWLTWAVLPRRNLSAPGHRNTVLCFSESVARHTKATVYPEMEVHHGTRNKALLKAIVAVNTWRADRLRSTIFVCKALPLWWIPTDDTNKVRAAIVKFDDSTVQFWMKMMSGIYPVSSCTESRKRIPPSACIATWHSSTSRAFVSFPENLSQISPCQDRSA